MVEVFRTPWAPEQQQCGWLLLSMDRFTGCELVMTQEFITSTLEVHCEGVTEGVLNLQHAGLICYARGNGHRKSWQVPGSVRYHTDHTSSHHQNADMVTSATSYIQRLL